MASLLAGGISAFLVPDVPVFSVAESGWFAAARRLVTISVVFGFLYLGAVILLHRGIRPLTQFAGLVREMISWKRSANLGSNASPKSNPDFSGASAVLTPAGPGEIA